MKKYKKITEVFVAVMLLLCMDIPIFAVENINPNRSIKLTISYHNESEALAGAKFSIYKVAKADKKGKLTVTKEFLKYHVNIPKDKDGDWKNLASTLEGYVLRDKILPTDSQKTNASGSAVFPTKKKKLTAGMYLVLGSRYTKNGIIYETVPFMVMLPTRGQNEKRWNYDVSVRPKYELYSQSEKDKVTCKVLKVWEDKNNKIYRPQNVDMQLLRNGKVFDTVTLNAKNNWRYQWKDLDAAYQWRVVEKQLKNYMIDISREGVTFVITNTYTPAFKVKPNQQIMPENPTTMHPAVPDETTEKSTTKHSTLPQTGQLWWPVPVLATIGLVMILVGVLHGRGINDEEKKR